EGISNALLEFMALGKPVIATNAGGSPELVAADTGFLIDAYADKQLAERISQLLDDAELRKRMGRNASAHVRERFNIQRMIDSFYDEYKRVALHADEFEAPAAQRVHGI